MSTKLTKNFSYSFPGQVWRILADEEEDRLVAEIREGERRRVHVAVIDHHKLLHSSLQIPEQWWISAVTLHKNILLLQTYADSQTPTPKDLLAIHIRSGKILWQHSSLQFAKLASTGVLTAHHTETGSTYQLIDINSGAIAATVPDHQNLIEGSNQISSILYPHHYTKENKYFDSIVSFLNQLLSIRAEKAFDYLEYKEWIIISYYLYTDNTLSNFLLVLDQQAYILLHEPIATQLAGIGLDTFFIAHNQLIFVKEKKEIISYEL